MYHNLLLLCGDVRWKLLYRRIINSMKTFLTNKVLHENFLFHNCLSKQLDNLLQTNPIKLGSKELFILYVALSSRHLMSCRYYTDWYGSSIWPLNLWQPVWHQREGWSCGLPAVESCRDARNEAGDWIKWLCLLPPGEMLKLDATHFYWFWAG